MEMSKGKVWLVGAGPGEIGLLTQKAITVIEQADFIAYDALIGEEILCMLPEDAEKVSVGKRSGRHSVSQEKTNQILLEEALKGKKVVRLKGGDPFVFGRGGEELELLVQYGIPFEVVPGVTSAVAVPAYAGIPVTHRDYTSSFHVITGHPRRDGKDRIDYGALVRMDATLVFLMSVGTMGMIMENLVKAGMDPKMPAAVLERGTQYRQRKVISTVDCLERDSKDAKIQAPAVIVVGRVCTLSELFAWYEKRELAQMQIIVTRSRKKASKLTAQLRESGAEVLELPMIDTTAIAPEQIRLDELFDEPAGRELWLTFTSPVGVETFFSVTLPSLGKDIRGVLRKGADVRFAAVGEATAKELEKYGWMTDVVPEVYNGRELGKALVRTARKDAKVYLLHARQGSEELKEELKRADLAYEDIAIYETICRQDSPWADMVKDKINQGLIDWVTFTSASTVRGFVQTMGGMDFCKVPALCIGEQTATEARKYHMKIEISDRATIASMVEKLKELRAKQEV